MIVREGGTLKRSRFYAWWYFTIAAGFVLLAVNRILIGGKPWLIALRFAIAAGFGLLAWFELRTRRR
jgi:hypothetical protein